MTRHVLVVTTAPDPSDELLERLERDAGTDVEVAVVAPAADASVLEWFYDDDRRAREEAQRRAIEAAEVEALGARVVRVDVGDPDPVVAIKDALATFRADELVVVTRPKEAATWLEKRLLSGELERLGLPITHLVDDDASAAEAAATSGRLSFAGRSVGVTVIVAVVLIAVALALYFSLR
ncbi:MAG: universal stress protein [Gaiellaceae bacterium]